MFEAFKTNEANIRRHDRRVLVSRNPLHARPEGNIFLHCEPIEESSFSLEYHGAVGAWALYQPTSHEDFPGSRSEESGDHSQYRRLATPARPKQTEEFAGLYGQVDGFDRHILTVGAAARASVCTKCVFYFYVGYSQQRVSRCIYFMDIA